MIGWEQFLGRYLRNENAPGHVKAKAKEYMDMANWGPLAILDSVIARNPWLYVDRERITVAWAWVRARKREEGWEVALIVEAWIPPDLLILYKKVAECKEEKCEEEEEFEVRE